MRKLPNPYPTKNSWDQVTNVMFVDDLVVKRFPIAVRAQHDPGVEIDAEFIVSEPFRLSYNLDNGKGREVTVPKGFLSDGVSVLGNNEGTRRFLEASIVHDYLYVAWQFLEAPHERKPAKWDQQFADKLFYRALLESNVDSGTAWLMYKAVRSFGWSQYKERDPISFIDL